MSGTPKEPAGKDRKPEETTDTEAHKVNTQETKTDAHVEGRPPGSTLDSAAHDRIGRKLKALYDEVVNEPVPDELMDLLRKLDDKG